MHLVAQGGGSAPFGQCLGDQNGRQEIFLQSAVFARYAELPEALALEDLQPFRRKRPRAIGLCGAWRQLALSDICGAFGPLILFAR